ncbi:phosphatase PAP2 family protein [Thermoactinospora rubra]|uniref:phosphatase PAP2 family protein n=1 Tax=Thermoactinospora rubra TaxID=1088767 RepID=UPI000A10681A|nr:phosphatase PAP2 family protein [Thermoactinospora rubra]
MVTFGVGKAVTGLGTPEAAPMRELARARTPLLDTLSDIGSSLSDTPYVVAMTAIAAIAFRLAFKRWRESVFLVVAVWSQSLVFLATTELVGRSRPEVPHLDPAPPTSSWPSGHVSAAVCFYAGVAIVLTLHTRRPWHPLWWAVGTLAPLAVALSRLYRGMHYFSDVLWGVLLGAVCLAVAVRAVLLRRSEPARRRPSPAPARAPSP